MANAWTIEFEGGAAKQLRKLDRDVQNRILEALDRLAKSPLENQNVKKLQGHIGGYRLRVGDWRILYKLENNRLIVLVFDIGHRREVYRR